MKCLNIYIASPVPSALRSSINTVLSLDPHTTQSRSETCPAKFREAT